MLTDAESRYSMIEKVVLALVTAKKKLRHYFESHAITVITSYPLRQVLSKPDLSGRLTKWAIELGVYDIKYAPKTSRKGQAVADFLVEIQSFRPPEKQLELPEGTIRWTLHTDGAVNKKGAGVGILLTSDSGVKIEEAIRLTGSPTNNEAEYEALMHGLRLAIKVGVRTLHLNLDSELISGHLNGKFEARDPRMRRYFERVQETVKRFSRIEVQAIRREMNSQADSLAKKAASGDCEKEVRLTLFDTEDTESLGTPSIGEEVSNPESILMVRAEEDDWTDSIRSYLESGAQPEDKGEARRLRLKAARYSLIEGELFRWSFDGPLLRCVREQDQEYVLQQLHSGVCGSHTGGRSLAHRILSAGYYWPYMMQKAKEFSRKCLKCQKHAPAIHQPSEALNSIVSPWPFARWGLDILGKLPTAKGGNCFILVATDYFTNWMEAEAYTKVTQFNVVNFIWKNIICRFGLPRALTMDNGTQFNNPRVAEFCEQHGIRINFSPVYYPQANGMAEATNRVLVNNLKRRLEKEKGGWLEELPKVLWAQRTTRKEATGETPFSLVYGSEAVLPTEAGLPTAKTLVAEHEKRNQQQLAKNLDLVEEMRECAQIRRAAYQQKTRSYFNKRVKERRFAPGEWVLRKIPEAQKDGKFGEQWEGPYEILEDLGKGTYRLLNPKNGKEVPRTWNAQMLKKYYM